MTWSAMIVKGDGTGRSDGFHGNVCVECAHGGQQQYGHAVCNVQQVSYAAANLLTTIDVGSDGHMAAGEAVLRCFGFEPKQEESVKE